MDAREAILARLVVVSANIEGVQRVYRNQIDLDEGVFPAIVILDADESRSLTAPRIGRNADSSPALLELKPEVFIVLGSLPESVGAQLNALRRALIKAVLTDQTLLSLCQTVDGDRIRYDGCMTALASGRSMIGEMMLAFTFTYVLRPEDL